MGMLKKEVGRTSPGYDDGIIMGMLSSVDLFIYFKII